MKAMESSRNFPMSGKVDVEETYVGGQDDQAIGRNEGRKQIVVVSIERKGKGVSRMYGRVIMTACKKNLKGFMKDHINPEADVRTDQWAGYKGLEWEFPNIICTLLKGKQWRRKQSSIWCYFYGIKVLGTKDGGMLNLALFPAVKMIQSVLKNCEWNCRQKVKHFPTLLILIMRLKIS